MKNKSLSAFCDRIDVNVVRLFVSLCVLIDMLEMTARKLAPIFKGVLNYLR